jgi:hypothetical protein
MKAGLLRIVAQRFRESHQTQKAVIGVGENGKEWYRLHRRSLANSGAIAYLAAVPDLLFC